MKGWPETREKLTEPMTTYFTFRDELPIHVGIILKGDRVVIPPAARDDIVKRHMLATLVYKAASDVLVNMFIGQTWLVTLNNLFRSVTLAIHLVLNSRKKH